MEIMHDEKMPPAQFDVVNNIKEQRCAVYLPDSQQPPMTQDDVQYELPDADSTIITIGDRMRYQPSEILFDPEILHEEDQVVQDNKNSDAPPLTGLHNLLQQSISKCDRELQTKLLENVVLAGGTSMLKGFPDRLRREMQLLYGNNNVTIQPDSQRKFASWVGASMFGTLPTFNLLVYTKTDWSADKTGIVHKRYF